MAYIYLKELKEILPDILDQWIDKDDESWEWIFQEIEQKCHVGKKGKKKKKFDKEEYIRRNRVDIDTLINKFQQLDKDLKQAINNNTQLILSVKDMGAEIRHMRDDVKAAKSMAETAKQRTEIDYSKYSGKSLVRSSYSKEAKKLNEELNNMTSNDIAQWCREQNNKEAKENEQTKTTTEPVESCASCKHYFLYADGFIKEPCISCENYDHWEAKENE